MADGSVVIDVKLNSADAQSGIAQIKAGLGGIGPKGVAAGALIADGIKAGASALVGFAKDSIATGMTFEQSMSNVAALSGASGAELEALSNKAKEMGSTTTFSASQCADALSYMALAGWDTSQSIEGLDGVLALAQAGQMDLAAASDMVTDYLSAFGMEASQSAQFADVLAYAQANANTSAEGLGMAFKNCAANAHAAGMDVETATAAISMMANQGLKGSEAGTALNAVMRDMTAKMKDGAIQIGQTAVQVQDAQGNYRDFADILADVETATNGMGDAEKAAALQSTFTADSIKGLNLLLNAGSDELVGFRDGLYNSGGAAQEMAAVMTDNLNGALAGMNSAIEGVQIQVFEAMAPLLTSIANTMTTAVIPAISAFVTALTGSADTVGDVDAMVSPLQSTFAQMGAAVRGVADTFAPFASAAMPVITQIASAVGGVLATAFNTAMGIVKSVVAAFGPTVTSMLTTVNGVIPPIKTVVESAFKAIEAVVSAVMPVVGAVVKAGWAVVSGVINGVVKPILGIVSGVFSGIMNAVTSAMNSVKSAINSAKAVFSSIASTFSSVGRNIVTGIINGVTGAAGQLMSSLKNLATNALNAAKSALGIHSPSKKFEKEIGEQAINGMIKGIENKKENAKKSAEEVSKLVLKAAEDKMAKLKKINEVSVYDEYLYWERVKDASKKGSEAYKGAVQHMAEAKKAATAEVQSLRDEMQKSAEDAEKLMQAYNDAVQKRADSILGAFSLFNEFEQKEAVSSQSLIDNLRSQVKAAEAYATVMESLRARLGESSLFTELEKQGVGSLADLQAVNAMTDEQLSEYVALYEQRSESVQGEAIATNAKLLEDTKEKLKSIEDETAKSLKNLKEQFKKCELKLPKVKLPHFSISGDFDVKSGSVPTVSVDWYARGGIFNGASVIGVGEAGPEAVVPLSGQQMQPFAEAIADNMNMQAAVETLLRALPAIIANNTPDSISINKREFGRLVREV